MVLDDFSTSERLRYFEVPFSCFDVLVIRDDGRNCWCATDNGLAATSWLTAYDQWPPNWESIIGACGVKYWHEEFYAFGNRAEEVARRLIVTLLYLDQIRKQKRWRQYETDSLISSLTESN